MKKKETIIQSVILGGIKKPQLHISGIKNADDDIYVLIDSRKIDLKDNHNLIIDRDFVFQEQLINSDFNYTVDISFDAKKAEIGIKRNGKKEIVFTKNVSLLFRLFNKIHYLFAKLSKFLIRIPRVFIKIIRIAWTRHHFIIPPKLIKQYIKSIGNNMSNQTIEERYYSPLKQTDYLRWLEENEKENNYETFKYNPLISVLVPVYNVNRKYLSECIDSVLNQTYHNWELCLADDKSTKEETLTVLQEYERKDKRIKVVYREKNGHISEATNSALKVATGEFIGLLDNDDLLHKDALYEVVKVLNKDKKIDMIYTDEDKININGKRYFPHFKPDFSPDTLLSSNYICHFTVLRKKIMEEINGFRSEYNGSQDYDLFLRFSEKTNNIHHISKILYHWREIEGSTAMSGSNKNYAYIAGQKALEDTLKRRKIKGDVIAIGTPQMYIMDYKYEKEPKISIVIPTKDKVDLLKECVDSIYEKTCYKNYELIIIDNNSQEEETFKFLKKYKREHDNFRYYRYECEFNYSYLNNEAVKKSDGEYIVFLNNDTEIITKEWLSRMVGYAMQDHIGCVGAKLLYPNNTIQHCGVITGVGGVASHAFIGTGMSEYGYFGRLVVPYNWSMGTAACLMIKKSVFEKIGGFDVNLKVAYNDVDLNVRVKKEGLYNVVLPQVKLYHYESISRGSDLSDDKRDRFVSEIKYITSKLGTDLIRDEFYNDNFSKDYFFVLDRKENINDK